jgi:hypothetical protein
MGVRLRARRAGTGGGDHLGTAGHGELHGQRTDAARGTGDEHRLVLAQGYGVQAVQRGGPGQAQRAAS